MRTFFYSLCHPARRYLGSLLALLCWSSASFAGVLLDSTRLIVSDNLSKGANISVRSESNSLLPFLVKAQVFGDVEGRMTQVPFVVTPPVFRLEPGDTQQLRVVSKGAGLPQDRESIFYLSVSALPTSVTGQRANDANAEGRLNVATGNIIKLFYRPAGLALTQREAMAKLQFTATTDGIKVTNPTPYYITLASLRVDGKLINIRTAREQNMLAPFASATYGRSSQSGAIQWQAINDFGSWEVFNASTR